MILSFFLYTNIVEQYPYYFYNFDLEKHNLLLCWLYKHEKMFHWMCVDVYCLGYRVSCGSVGRVLDS